MQKLMSTRDLAEKLGFAIRTIEGWRLKGIGPEFITINERVRYRPEDVSTWLDGRKGTQAVPKGGE
jgi:predicted site-specific integrase-resolvase